MGFDNVQTTHMHKTLLVLDARTESGIDSRSLFDTLINLHDQRTSRGVSHTVHNAPLQKGTHGSEMRTVQHQQQHHQQDHQTYVPLGEGQPSTKFEGRAVMLLNDTSKALRNRRGNT